jgi:hypothetical protein
MAAAADLLQWEEPAWELPGLRRLALVPATAALGFHHAYFLSLPERIDVPALVVEGNNQGEERDYARPTPWTRRPTPWTRRAARSPARHVGSARAWPTGWACRC